MHYICNVNDPMIQSTHEAVPPRTQEERSAATRAKLIDATIELLLEYGLSACSLAAVAKRAGLTTGAMQHQFQTKAKLMRAVIVERLFDVGTIPDTSELFALTFEQRCRRLVAMQWSFYGKPHYLAIWEIILGAKADMEIQDEIGAWQQTATRAHENVIREVFADLDLDHKKVRLVQYFVNAHLRGLALLQTVEDDCEIIDHQLTLLSEALASILQEGRN